MRNWGPWLLIFFWKILFTFYEKKFTKYLAKNVQKKIFFCVKFLQIKNLHTDFRPREESVRAIKLCDFLFKTSSVEPESCI